MRNSTHLSHTHRIPLMHECTHTADATLLYAEICSVYLGTLMQQGSIVCIWGFVITGICMHAGVELRYLPPHGGERQRRCGLMVADSNRMRTTHSEAA
jgi:hypothetical protein